MDIQTDNSSGTHAESVAGADQKASPAPSSAFTESEIKDKVLAMVGAAEAVKKATIELSTSLESISMDSLEKLSVAMDLEELFGIYITDETVEGFQTVGDIADYLIEQGLAKPIGDSGQSLPIGEC